MTAIKTKLFNKRIKIEEHLIENDKESKLMFLITSKLFNRFLVNDRNYINAMLSILKKL